VQKIIREVFFDDIALVTSTNDKIIDAEKYRSMIKGDKLKIVISEGSLIK
jgi:hypothetical protein